MARVFVLDDEPAIVWILKEALAAAGHEVTAETDARRALSRLEEQPRPDVLLVDLRLPGIRGRELIEALRARPSLRATPILLMTGSAPGGNDFPPATAYQALIPKPFDLDQVVEAVARFAGSRSGVAAR